jgi:hypothetical protein
MESADAAILTRFRIGRIVRVAGERLHRFHRRELDKGDERRVQPFPLDRRYVAASRQILAAMLVNDVVDVRRCPSSG